MSHLFEITVYTLLSLEALVLLCAFLAVLRARRRVARLERFAEQTCALWDNMFARCAVCKSTLFKDNAATIVHTDTGTQYLCEDCRDAKL